MPTDRALGRLIRSSLMTTGEDTNTTELLGWTVFGEGKYSHHIFTQIAFEMDLVFNVCFIFLGRTFSQGKDLTSSPQLLIKMELNQLVIRNLDF